MHLGVRTWGNSLDGPVVMLTGTYQMRRRDQPPAARGAAQASAMPGDEWESPLVATARRRDRQGRARSGGGARPAARSAPDRRPARLVRTARRPRRRPGTGRTATPWWAGRCGCSTTIPGTRGRWPRLAAETGVSRAALARRFTELVGEPPIAYPDRVAAGRGRRPAPRNRHHRRGGGQAGRLRQRLRAQRRIQAGAGGQSAGAPHGVMTPWPHSHAGRPPATVRSA